MTIYLEDLVVGAKEVYGSHTFTKEEIVTFARAFDPQPFHLDEEAARRSLFGALCASGWQTAAIWMRMAVDYYARRAAEDRLAGKQVPPAGPSPGMTKLRWPNPVFVGDTITYASTVTAIDEDPKRADWGIATSADEGVNQRGELVYAAIGRVYVKRKNPRAT